MRLREISKIIQEVDLGHLKLAANYNNNNSTYTVKNLTEFREAIIKLSAIPAMRQYVELLESSAVFSTNLNSFTITISDYNSITEAASMLRLGSAALANSINEQLRGEQLQSVSIKLPDSKSLRDIVNDLDIIEKGLSLVLINPEIDGKVEVNTWEPGSLWIELFLGSAAATVVVGSIAWASAVIHKKIQEGKIIEQHVRTLSIKNDSLENLVDAQRASIEMQIESEALAIYRKTYSEEKSDPEQIQRLQFTIKAFSKLIDKGAEIHPALSAPESVTNLFPSMINPMSIESKIPRIEDSATGSSPG